MKLPSIALFLFWTQMSFGQSDANFISRQQALEDLRIFEISLREIHPNIYRYTSKSEFDSAYKNARNSIGETIGLVQFNNIITSIMSLVRCGHSFGITSFIDDKKGILPLDVKISNNKIFVIKNVSLNKEPRAGSEILSINGIDALNLLDQLRNNSVADGYNVTFKDRIIERDFRVRFATLINQPDSFKIEFKDYLTATHKTLTIAALSYEAISQALKKLDLPIEKPLGLLIDRENDVAILKLRSFMAQRIKKQNGQKLIQTIKKSFREIERNKISNLIIDIRWNTGGKASAPPLLFSYLTKHDFKFKQKIVFRHGYQFSFPQYLNRDKFNDWVNKHLDKKINDTTYEWTHHRNTKGPYKASNKSFEGKVYIVVNGMTASAGAEFASLARVNGKCIFVGEETGGDFNGVNGYERTYLLLPNSKVGVLIAGWRSVMAWDENRNIGRGVLPDYEVHPSLEDLLTGQDTEMKFTYDLIKKGN